MGLEKPQQRKQRVISEGGKVSYPVQLFTHIEQDKLIAEILLAMQYGGLVDGKEYQSSSFSKLMRQAVLIVHYLEKGSTEALNHYYPWIEHISSYSGNGSRNLEPLDIDSDDDPEIEVKTASTNGEQVTNNFLNSLMSLSD